MSNFGEKALRKATGLDEGSRAIAVGSEQATDPETFERVAGRPKDKEETRR